MWMDRRKGVCAGGSRCVGLSRCRAIHRLPIGKGCVRKEYALGAEGLDACDLEIRTVKPDFAQDFQLVAATQNGQDVVASLFVVELRHGYGFFFANWGPKQRVQQMLWPEILYGFGTVS